MSLSPKAFSDNWEYFPYHDGNNAYTIRFDTAISDLDTETKAHYPHTFELLLHADEKDDNGYLTAAEKERLNSIEDSLLCGDYDMYTIGAITGGNCVRIVFCLGGEIEIEADSLAQIMLGDNRHIQADSQR